MRPIFTIHAGEYLVGNHIEKIFPTKYSKECNIWVPGKDTGIDLLVTDKFNRKTVTIQVKFSKDYSSPQHKVLNKANACGWLTLNPKKILQSTADYWVIVLYKYSGEGCYFLVIEPGELYKRLVDIKGVPSKDKSFNTYLWVNKNDECWETRDLKTNEINEVLEGKYGKLHNTNTTRDFSSFLNNFTPIADKL